MKLRLIHPGYACAFALFWASACAVDDVESEPLVVEEDEAEVDGTPEENIEGADSGAAEQRDDTTSDEDVAAADDGIAARETDDTGGGSEARGGPMAESVRVDDEGTPGAFPPGAGIGATTGTQTDDGVTPTPVGGPNAAAESFPPGAGIGSSTGTQTNTPSSVGGPNAAAETFPPGAGIGATTGTQVPPTPTTPTVIVVF